MKIMYTISELAAMSGETRWKLGRLLKANKVTLYPTGEGRKKVIMLTQLRKAFPDLWDSIQERARLMGIRIPDAGGDHGWD